MNGVPNPVKNLAREKLQDAISTFNQTSCINLKKQIGKREDNVKVMVAMILLCGRRRDNPYTHLPPSTFDLKRSRIQA